MVDMKRMFEDATTVLVIDWPTREVPEMLALAGFRVAVRGGPGPRDHSSYEVSNGAVVSKPEREAPEHADMIYSYRPLNELPEIIATARRLGAKAIWTQSGFSSAGGRDPKGCWLADEDLERARNLVDSAGLKHVSEPYIGDAVKAGQLRAKRE